MLLALQIFLRVDIDAYKNQVQIDLNCNPSRHRKILLIKLRLGDVNLTTSMTTTRWFVNKYIYYLILYMGSRMTFRYMYPYEELQIDRASNSTQFGILLKKKHVSVQDKNVFISVK